MTRRGGFRVQRECLQAVWWNNYFGVDSQTRNVYKIVNAVANKYINLLRRGRMLSIKLQKDFLLMKKRYVNNIRWGISPDCPTIPVHFPVFRVTHLKVEGQVICSDLNQVDRRIVVKAMATRANNVSCAILCWNMRHAQLRITCIDILQVYSFVCNHSIDEHMISTVFYDIM